MSNNQKPQLPDTLPYFALALDPIHVGTGGYRLGRVDMSIVREPGTNVPKIPGTSLAGACRTYAAMVENRYRWQKNGKTYICAGQGQPDQKKQSEGHCGKHDCPICVTFGFTHGERGSFQGLAQFSDARLVLFPVHSLAGPVWVTCADVLNALKEFEQNKWQDIPNEAVRTKKNLLNGNRLNLGWLMLQKDEKDEIEIEFDLSAKLPNVPAEIREILPRAVLVSNKLFSHIVNDNLEVRTSVSIDPSTGAAAEGALFTYEALPRASVLAFEVVISDPRFYKIDGKTPLDSKIETVIETVREGCALFKDLGVGGMGTRGMGRLRVWESKQGGAQ